VARYDALTADGLRELRRARDQFLAGGLRDDVLPELPAELLAAWRRALFYGVVPDRPSVPRVPVSPSSALLTAAAPVLDRLAQGLASAELAVVLTDARGRVEHVHAHGREVRRHLERIGTGPGADLSELATGLNGISAVVRSGRPALVRGPQHILGLYQETTCAGAPIRDPVDGRVRGALSLVCDLEAPPLLLSTLAESAAGAIEQELLHATQPRERVLLDAFLPERARGAAVLALDGRSRLVSDAAALLLVDDDLPALEELAAAAARAGRLPATGVLLPGSGRHALLREIPHGGRLAGVLVTVQAGAAPRPAVRRVPARPAPALPGLVGSSPAWQALLARVVEVATAPVLVLTGEPGSGRGAVARAIGAGEGGPVVELDAADLLTDGSGSWPARLAAARERARAVVVHGADTVPDRCRAAVRSALARPAPGRVLLTGEPADGAAAWHRALVPDGRAAVVEVPPLRERLEDLGALVGAFSAAVLPGGAVLRTTLDADAVLRRWPWPGNVAELRLLVAGLCADVGAGRPVTPADLPEELRRSSRRFSPLEQAERTAIRAALRSHDGNRSRAAAALGIGRATLYRKLRYYGLDLP
jgi:sigma-54 dependent transcriptional regulator, acetoin dehydrogenase operon transcriptional activator AcoR